MSPFALLLLCWVGVAQSYGGAAVGSRISSIVHRPLASATRAPPPVAQEDSADAPAGPVLTCSRCKASYVIDEAAFGTGKQVKCTNCGHEWYQSLERLSSLPPDMELVEYPEKMRERMAQGLTAEPQAGFRAYVGNLPFTASEGELEELFAEYGTVIKVDIMLDEMGRSRGFAFVDLEKPEDGAKAVEGLDKSMLSGRELSVSQGRQPMQRGRGRGRGRGDFRGRGDGRGRGRGGPPSY